MGCFTMAHREQIEYGHRIDNALQLLKFYFSVSNQSNCDYFQAMLGWIIAVDSNNGNVPEQVSVYTPVIQMLLLTSCIWVYGYDKRQ